MEKTIITKETARTDQENGSGTAGFLTPNGVVVVGASTDPRKLGYAMARNLVESDFPGPVYLVNPKGGEVFGQKLYAGIELVPDPCSLAILLIPARFVPGAIRECGKKGISSVVIASAGFAEGGQQGSVLQEQCLAVAEEYGVRLLGPNCVGLLNTANGLNATFLSEPLPLPGSVAFLSQSGAMCAVASEWTHGSGFGLSHLISLGNEVDLTVGDFLSETSADPAVKVLALYLEGIRRGEEFVRTAREAVARVPVLALKVGRTAAGVAAAKSHTGALAGEDRVLDAVLDSVGIQRVDTTAQLFDHARTLSWCPVPEGNAVAILTNAGGPGVAAADSLESYGLKAAALSRESELHLRGLLPPAASVGNPVDMLASASPDDFGTCLSVLLDDPSVDSVVVILPPPPSFSVSDVADRLITVAKQDKKPVLVALMSSARSDDARFRLRNAEIPVFMTPEQAVESLGVLAQRRRILDRKPWLLPEKGSVNNTRSFTVAVPEDGSWIDSAALEAWLSTAGLSFPDSRFDSTEEGVLTRAEQLGFPVAMKVVAAGVSHKTDVDGVKLDVTTLHEVRAFFREKKQQFGDDLFSGIQLQEMVPAGLDCLVGAIRDPEFGPLLVFGSGGVEVEEEKDVAFGLWPAPPADLLRMIGKTRAGRRMYAGRNRPDLDKKPVVNALQVVGRFLETYPAAKEVEINPFRLFPDGGIALDARAR